MKPPKKRWRIVTLLALVAGIANCAVEERTGRALADALADGPVRDYASVQADLLLTTCFALRTQAAPESGTSLDLPGAQQSWRTARAAYERGVAVFLAVAADLDFALDGHLDDRLARTGLRHLEPALFGAALAPPAELDRLTAALVDAAAALHVAVADHGRELSGPALVASMAAVASVVATKFDGSASPYAGAALLAVEHDLIGLQAVYAILSPLIRGADAELDQRITLLLRQLLEKVRTYSSPDAIADKASLLRECDELSQALQQVGTVLGFTITQVNLS